MLAAAITRADAQTTSSPPDWIEFHRDNMQRWNPYETVLGVGNVGRLKLEWKNPIGVYDSAIASSPAVVNGVVYFGSEDGNVYALNASTGAKLWSFTTGNFVYSSPAVANGVVYFGSYDHNVYALNVSTGAKLWSFTTGGPVEFSSPAVANKVVYIGSDDGNVYALNASTGAKLWSFNTGDVALFSSPAVVNGVVYIGGLEAFYALNAGTGAKLWSFTTQTVVDSSPAVANGVVFFGGSADRNVYALNASTGARLWHYDTLGDVGSSPTIVDGMLYIRAGDQSTKNGNVYAFSLGGADLFLRIFPLRRRSIRATCSPLRFRCGTLVQELPRARC